MPTITILPHEVICPEGKTIEAKPGDNLMQLLLSHHVAIEHACEGAGTCATCHVYVRKGLDSLTFPSDIEDETLNRAWGLDMDSRLSCQVIIGDSDLTIELPKYTRNQVAER